MLRILSSSSCRWFRQMKTKTFHMRDVSTGVDSIFKAAADCNIAALGNYLQNTSVSDLNVRDEYGWTALMIAARHGNLSFVDHLLQNNADVALINKTGQSAYELAVFWQHRETAELLKKSELISKNSKVPSLASGPFSDALYRHSSLRVDKQWLEEMMRKPSSVFIAIHKGNPLVISDDSWRMHLSRFTYDEVRPFIDDQRLIFLGTEPKFDETDPKGYFCVDLGHLTDEDLKKFSPKSESVHMFQFLSLTDEDKRLIAQARPLFDWHRYRFCSRCGSKTKMDAAGYKRVCLNDKCSTHKRVHNISYPRVDPTVICSVISSDGQRCLLAHKPTHPANMYSCVAGFVEPGETMEEACVREVKEEVGLDVKSVRYLSSQYWPMPSCLMVGYITQVTDNDTIKLDEEELEDGRWFSRSEVVQMLTHQHAQKLFVPPKHAIAHHLIKAWVIDFAFKTATEARFL